MKPLENVLRLMQLLQLMQTQRILPKNPLNKLFFVEAGFYPIDSDSLLHLFIMRRETKWPPSVIQSSPPCHPEFIFVILSAAKDLTRGAPRSFAALRMTRGYSPFQPFSGQLRLLLS